MRLDEMLDHEKRGDLGRGLARVCKRRCGLCLVATASLICALPVQAKTTLILLIDSSTAMPMAQFAGTTLIAGIHRDLGIALARELRRSPAFILVPRKRIPLMLERGRGDIACHFLPAWLPGPFDWSEPFMPNALVLLSSLQVAEPRSIIDLRGHPVGTVLGFEYPDVVRMLRAGFVRDDAVNATLNLRKFDAGRSQYVLTGEVFLRYQQQRFGLGRKAREPLVVNRYLASCAVSRKGEVSVSSVNIAIKKILQSKEVDAIYNRYR